MKRFIAEILSQPESLDATLDYYLGDEGKARLSDVRKLLQAKKYRRLVFTGMGSSYFVSYAASSLFNGFGLNASAINTNELLYYHVPIIKDDTLVICLSQSGESAETLKLLQKLPGTNGCVGVSNEAESTLAVKIENAEIVRLMQISHDDIEMRCIAQFHQVRRQFVGYELVDAFGLKFLEETGISERIV